MTTLRITLNYVFIELHTQIFAFCSPLCSSRSRSRPIVVFASVVSVVSRRFFLLPKIVQIAQINTQYTKIILTLLIYLLVIFLILITKTDIGEILLSGSPCISSVYFLQTKYIKRGITYFQ